MHRVLCAVALAAPTYLLSAAGRMATSQPVQSALPRAAKAFIDQNCVGCHNKQTASGGLNLAATPFQPSDASSLTFWVKLHDRVAAGEMPPKGAPQPRPAARQTFLHELAQPLIAIQTEQARK